MRHCGLPSLPGRPPLGGEILSHDFVEAALLRRAGWELWMAPELGGSYEESPPTLLHYLKRDRRWCEGNLQHIRLIFAQGSRGSSRLHLAVGVMSYLSAPLWLAMLAVASVETFREQHFAPAAYAGRFPILALPVSHAMECVALFLVAALLLLGPKFLGWLMLAREPRRLAAHGGRGTALCSVLFEILFSTLLAPIVMISQSAFVASVFLGRSTTWVAQQRTSRGIGIGAAVSAFVSGGWRRCLRVPPFQFRLRSFQAVLSPAALPRGSACCLSPARQPPYPSPRASNPSWDATVIRLRQSPFEEMKDRQHCKKLRSCLEFFSFGSRSHVLSWPAQAFGRQDNTARATPHPFQSGSKDSNVSPLPQGERGPSALISCCRCKTPIPLSPRGRGIQIRAMISVQTRVRGEQPLRRR